MNVEEAKKIAEAIKRAQLNELTSVDEIVKILTTEPAAPVKKEYRAGEWVPPEEQSYWYITDNGMINDSINTRDAIDSYSLSQGNMFPTEAIAEAAKKHAGWWREFDMADEGGGWGIFVRNGRLLVGGFDVFDGTPRWQSEKSARAWIAANGGEAYVADMLTKGRVFRFKWGGE